MRESLAICAIAITALSLVFFESDWNAYAQMDVREVDTSQIYAKSPEDQQKILDNLDFNSKKKYEEILKKELLEISSNENIQGQGIFEGVGGYKAQGIAKVLVANDKQTLKLEKFVIADNDIVDKRNLSIHMIFDNLEEVELEGKLALHSDHSEHEFPYKVNIHEIRNIEIRENENTIVKIKLHSTKNIGEWLSIFGNQITQMFPFTTDSDITSGKLNINNIPSGASTCDIEFSDQFRQIGYLRGDQGSGTYGRVEKAVLDDSVQIRISNFNIAYDKDKYVKIFGNENTPPIISQPEPRIFLSTSDIQPREIDMQILDVNKGTRVLCMSIQEEPLVVASDYNIIKIQDRGTILATADLHNPYYMIDTSPELFFDWLVLFFMQNWVYVVIALAFPLTFDYLILSGKIIATVIFKSRNKKPEKSSLHNPQISIMIPAHNEEKGIESSIRSALNIPYSNKEIIVIDDGSTDDTYIIAKKFSDMNLIKLIHRREASGSKATALNYGSNFATGDLILCMDGDTVLERQSIQRIIDHFNDQDVVAVSGNVRVAGGDPDENGKPVNNILTSLQSYEYMVAMELGRRFSTLLLTTVTSIISGAFGVFRRSVFTSVGRYDIDTITEDFDLTLKMLKSRSGSGQSKIKFLDKSVAWTYCPNNMKSWIKQRERWAAGQYQTLKKHGSRKDYKNYKKRSLAAIYSMWFFDYGLNFAFVAYIIGIPIALATSLIDTHNFLNIITVVTAFNIIFEAIIFLSSNRLSSKKNYSLIYLVPIMALFYRPLLRFVTLKAHLKAMFGKTVKWG